MNIYNTPIKNIDWSLITLSEIGLILAIGIVCGIFIILGSILIKAISSI